MRVQRLLRWLMLVMTWCAIPAHAINYQDWWWAGAGESGWGLNLGHQGDTIFAAWFVYDVNRNPVWFTAVVKKTGNAEVYSGDVFQTTGTYFATVPFVTNPAPAQKIGSATFTFTNARAGTLAYTANSATVNKQITRFPIAPLSLSGTYVGGIDRNTTACTNAAANGSLRTPTDFIVSQIGSTIDLNAPGVCRFTGNYQQYGSVFEGQGNYTCSGNGTVGTWTATEGSFNERVFSAKMSMTVGGETCVVAATVGGFKP